MRDDIHRRLPLPGCWGRLAKLAATSPDLEARREAALKVLDFEYKNINPSLLKKAQKMSSNPQQSLSPSDALGSIASSPSDEAFIRHWFSVALTAGSVSPTSYKTALLAALKERIEANLRESRAQMISRGQDRPVHVDLLLSRMRESLLSVMNDAFDNNYRAPVAEPSVFDPDADIHSLFGE